MTNQENNKKSQTNDSQRSNIIDGELGRRTRIDTKIRRATTLKFYLNSNKVNFYSTKNALPSLFAEILCYISKDKREEFDKKFRLLQKYVEEYHSSLNAYKQKLIKSNLEDNVIPLMMLQLSMLKELIEIANDNGFIRDLTNHSLNGILVSSELLTQERIHELMEQVYDSNPIIRVSVLTALYVEIARYLDKEKQKEIESNFPKLIESAFKIGYGLYFDKKERVNSLEQMFDSLCDIMDVIYAEGLLGRTKTEEIKRLA